MRILEQVCALASAMVDAGDVGTSGGGYHPPGAQKWGGGRTCAMTSGPPPRGGVPATPPSSAGTAEHQPPGSTNPWQHLRPRAWHGGRQLAMGTEEPGQPQMGGWGIRTSPVLVARGSEFSLDEGITSFFAKCRRIFSQVVGPPSLTVRGKGRRARTQLSDRVGERKAPPFASSHAGQVTVVKP